MLLIYTGQFDVDIENSGGIFGENLPQLFKVASYLR